jgi:hypothetical protein
VISREWTRSSFYFLKKEEKYLYSAVVEKKKKKKTQCKKHVGLAAVQDAVR